MKEIFKDLYIQTLLTGVFGTARQHQGSFENVETDETAKEFLISGHF